MKNNHFLEASLLFSSFFILQASHPFFDAANVPHKALKDVKVASTVNGFSDSTFIETKGKNRIALGSIYDSLHLNNYGLSRKAFSCAISGFESFSQAGKFNKSDLLTIVDFSQPSTKKRLYVIDLLAQKMIFNTYVAHGKKSGTLYANDFSNAPESNKSSLGFYATTNTYVGKNGYSLQLHGLETGINDNAEKRAIVMHGADYADVRFAQAFGYLGRSWGCPAIPPALLKPVIDKIKNGTCLFIYCNDENYFRNSKVVRLI